MKHFITVSLPCTYIRFLLPNFFLFSFFFVLDLQLFLSSFVCLRLSIMSEHRAGGVVNFQCIFFPKVIDCSSSSWLPHTHTPSPSVLDVRSSWSAMLKNRVCEWDLTLSSPVKYSLLSFRWVGYVSREIKDSPTNQYARLDGWSFVFYMCCKGKDAETGVRKAKVNFIHQLPSAYFFFPASVVCHFALLYIFFTMSEARERWDSFGFIRLL